MLVSYSVEKAKANNIESVLLYNLIEWWKSNFVIPPKPIFDYQGKIRNECGLLAKIPTFIITCVKEKKHTNE